MASGVRPVLILALAGLAALSGCGPSGPPTYPVSGKVVFPDGRPVTSGMIEFAPVDGGPSARGKIGEDGRFTLMTGDRAGAVAGTHRIAVVQVAAGTPQVVGHKHRGIRVDPNYARFETSGLTREVRRDRPNEFEIEVDAAR